MMIWNITKFLMILSACIGLVNGLGIFTDSFYAAPQNDYTQYDMDDIESDFGVSNEGPSIGDYFDMAVSFITCGVFVILNMMMAVAFLFPYLSLQYDVPILLASVLQVALYIEYAAGYAQWKANRSLSYFK